MTINEKITKEENQMKWFSSISKFPSLPKNIGVLEYFSAIALQWDYTGIFSFVMVERIQAFASMSQEPRERTHVLAFYMISECKTMSTVDIIIFKDH